MKQISIIQGIEDINSLSTHNFIYRYIDVTLFLLHSCTHIMYSITIVKIVIVLLIYIQLHFVALLH